MKFFRKAALALLCAAVCAGAGTALADEAAVLTLPADLTVIDSEAFLNDTSLGKVIIPEGATTIESRAFAGSSVAEIILPSTLTYIADDAFEGCDGVKVTVAENSYAHEWCVKNSVEALALPVATPASDFTYTVADGKVTITGYTGSATGIALPSEIDGLPVTGIAPYAFYGKTALTVIVIPEGPTEIGISTFNGCTSLKYVQLPSTLTYIDTYAFFKCAALESIAIPEGVTRIGDNAFDSCTALETVKLPSTLTTLETGAFYNCTSLTGVALPSGLTTMGNNVFTKCSSMASLTLNEGLTSIGNQVFKNCDSLTTVTIPSTLTVLSDESFHSCDKLTTVVLPDTLTEIGDYAFSGCLALSEINFPASLETIGVKAFAVCYALDNVVLKEGLTTLGDSAFSGCNALTSISLPRSLTTIGSSVFADSYSVVATVHYGSEAHAWCEKYGIDMSVLDPFTYIVSGDAVTITGYTGKDSEVAIPAEIEGKPVTAIGDEAFLGDGDSMGFGPMIYGVTVPEGVTTIGARAFADNPSLMDVHLPQSITSIATDAFASSDYVTLTVYKNTYAHTWCEENGIAYNAIDITYTSGDYTYTLNDDGTAATHRYIGSDTVVAVPSEIDSHTVTVIGDGTFIEQTAITAITLPDTLTGIEPMAFNYCLSLKEISIPEGVTFIGWDAFYDCAALTRVSLPASLTSMDDNIFCSCDSLTSIEVAEGSATFSTVDGVLYSKDGSTLICYPIGLSASTFTVPAGVTSIGSGAFGEAHLTTVVLPAGVTSIGRSAFSNSELTAIQLPDSLTVIGEFAFSGCTSLAEIVIPGSVTTIDSNAFSECTALTEIVIPESVTTLGSDIFSGCAEDFVLYVYEDSAAHRWCEEYGYAYQLV